MLKPILSVSFWTPSFWTPSRTRTLACAVVLAAFPLSAGVSRAQQQGAQSPYPMPNAANTGPLGARGGRVDDPSMAVAEEKRFKELNVLRQKEMTAQSARLLLLATQVKSDLDKSGGDASSLDLIHKVEQIEKLAHSVRTKMTDGILN